MRYVRFCSSEEKNQKSKLNAKRDFKMLLSKKYTFFIKWFIKSKTFYVFTYISNVHCTYSLSSWYVPHKNSIVVGSFLFLSYVFFFFSTLLDLVQREYSLTHKLFWKIENTIILRVKISQFPWTLPSWVEHFPFFSPYCLPLQYFISLNAQKIQHQS